jgi:iron complex transport system substrate-binding protein
MHTITDHLGRQVTFPHPPKRIISLVPAITETMYYLDLEDTIVGRTRFCKFPQEKVLKAKNIGGTKEIKLDRINQLKPDLIIAEKEENTKEIVETLEKHYPVFVFEVQKEQDVYRMIKDLGFLTDRKSESIQMIKEIQQRLDSLPKVFDKRAAYVIWKKPYMVVGKDTYIQSILTKLGFINPFLSLDERYPVITEEDFQNANLEYIFLATEPYPFREKHIKEFEAMVPQAKTLIIDGEMFWYGAKMIQAAEYFKRTIEAL